MKRTSFRSKLLLLIVILIFISLLTTIVAVMRATNTSVEALVNEQLVVAERVFLTLLEDEREQLQRRGELLAGDFALRRAIATGDKSTIESALANHGERIEADLVLLISEDHKVVMSTHDVDQLAPQFDQALANDNQASTYIRTIIQSEPYQLVLVPVHAPDLIGWVGLGQAIDQQLLGSLKRITNTDITLVYSAGAAVAQRTTLADTLLSPAGSDNSVAEAIISRTADLRSESWLSRDVVLLNTGTQQLDAILSSSLDAALEDYKPLRLQMIVIALLALALAAFTSFLASRWVTRPIYHLVSAATKIADGNYSQHVHLEADEEFTMLAGALNLMQDTVAEREARILHQAQYDLLTQLPNKNYILSLFTNYTAENAVGANFGLALLELSNLPNITDLYGGEFADMVLQQVSARILDSLRRGDMAARVADTQILLLFDDLDYAGVDRVAAKLQADFTSSFTVSGVPVKVKPVSGFVLCPQHGLNFDDVLRRAQIALSHAREKKQDHAVYQVGQDEVHLRQIRVANRLQVAVRERAFTVNYQPKYNLHTLQVEQVEALMRWTDSELGTVFPDEFIPLAEQTGIITQISDIVVDEVISQLQAWRLKDLNLCVCVNLSGIDILRGDFVRGVIQRLAASGLPPEAMVMEITETAMVTDTAVANVNIALFQAAGIRLSIDDFGTGFSSLAQLKTLPVQELKIDQSLIKSLDTEPDDQLIVRSTIEMGHYLGLDVVAEGVENARILKLLHQMGCDAIQGYHLARPMTAEQLSLWMSDLPQDVLDIPELINASL